MSGNGAGLAVTCPAFYDVFAAIVAVPVRQVVRSKTDELGHTAVSETITRWLRCLHWYLYAQPCEICIVDSENISVSCSIQLAAPQPGQYGV
jgi:hypothetical protein